MPHHNHGQHHSQCIQHPHPHLSPHWHLSRLHHYDGHGGRLMRLETYISLEPLRYVFFLVLFKKKIYIYTTYMGAQQQMATNLRLQDGDEPQVARQSLLASIVTWGSFYQICFAVRKGTALWHATSPLPPIPVRMEESGGWMGLELHMQLKLFGMVFIY